MYPPNLLDSLYLLVPLALGLSTGWAFIGWLKGLAYGQFIREDGPQAHQSKAGTPTMGGLLILGCAVFGALLMLLLQPFLTPLADPNYFETHLSWDAVVVLAVGIVLGGLGFGDDYQKVAKKQNKGVTGYTKLAVQALVGVAVGMYVSITSGQTGVSLFGLWDVDLGWFYPIFATLVVMATSNAVNLTDGLDGLAGTTVCITLLGMMAIFLGFNFSDVTPTVVHGDLVRVCLLLMGGTLAFLMFNLHPAKVFMGDVGSLSLGGMIATIALIGKLDFWLVLLGGLFVIEALSVILQVISFKTTGKRIFRMSPLHHHFELCGWSEVKVVTVFAWTQVVLGILAVFLYNRV